ncbi:carbamate kinase [Cryobacterium sp. TMT1-21]|uniref:Carbamate kinase n=1 Tax=Cryobacterium shii TaxID=1259235 RepID=A0AAQ2C7V1_9MICO|nr:MULTISPECIES: carbamate kinase [Cryobacterium]TFC50813.1 carbamate kinase [Cryobacterium shii]TFC86782.1 carbamate kinase [Cryobacterium sp. TmT2-59]TFD17187.1 carbamate kinase [Cryobacterium sp. TMT1-21]TFD19342.1 carbamate kinase [Cryobacterium sp. TMT4-10]TFD26401.1 carbamate kinase [Cryobacterium sp. TMT2-23]
MRIVVALGGNALQERGAPMTVQNQRANVAKACAALAPIAQEHQLVISHGNGPQVGLLALQAAAYDHTSEYPFDVLGAQTEGMIGYMIEQELGNRLPFEKSIATILTMTEVDPADPAFTDPTKFVGPVYDADEARRLAVLRGWVVKPDGDHWRRVVPSPMPQRIFELSTIKTLVEADTVVICAGGGGIPTMYQPGSRKLIGVDAVIDKDRASAVLARDLKADSLVIATDADAVYTGWGTPEQRAIMLVHPDTLANFDFPAGSMGPKVEAAIDFARNTGRDAFIGSLTELPALLDGTAGTRVSVTANGVAYR